MKVYVGTQYYAQRSSLWGWYTTYQGYDGWRGSGQNSSRDTMLCCAATL